MSSVSRYSQGRHARKSHMNRIREVEEEDGSSDGGGTLSPQQAVPHTRRGQDNVARRTSSHRQSRMSYFSAQQPWVRETLKESAPKEPVDKTPQQRNPKQQPRPGDDDSASQDDDDDELLSLEDSLDDAVEIDYKACLPAAEETPSMTKAPMPPPSPDTRISSAGQMADDGVYHAPTKLHEVCYNATCANDIVTFLDSFQGSPGRRISKELSSAASLPDSLGRIPLHLISENAELADALFPLVDDDTLRLQPSASTMAEICVEKEVTAFLFDVLVAANPMGLKWEDSHGYIPFQQALVEWIHEVHDEDSPKRRRWKLGSRRFSSYSRLTAPSKFQHIVHSTSQSVTTAIAWAGKSLPFQSPSSSKAVYPHNVDVEDASTEDSCVTVENVEGYVWAPDRFPSEVRLTPQAKFAIKMVSALLDKLDDYVSSRSFKRRTLLKRPSDGSTLRCSDSFEDALENLRDYCFTESSDKIASQVVQKLAGTPNLVKTLFLLDDEDEREWVLSSTLFRRIVLDKNSIGPWLTSMLQSSEKRVSKRGLEYLGYLSDTLEANEGGWGSSKHMSSSNVTQASPHEELHQKVSELEGFIQSLLALNESGIEEAATTLIVRMVLHRMISRPFAVSVVLFDAIFLTLLIISFRGAVNKFLTGALSSTVLTWVYVANMCTFYFIIRELGKGITILERTRTARIYFLSFWNLTDILSVSLALSSTIAIRVMFREDEIDYDSITPLRGLLAVTTGMLWLRVLSLLKTINMQLATFVLAIFQITRDILWFLLILLTMVVAFAQMFYTLLVPSECASTDDKPDDMVCKPAEYYLRTYMILLGDFGNFERENFTTAFSVLLIVFFSFMVVIVLLNVLIAIVSDSYEKCLIRSQSLFGRARVMLIAELVSFQNLLRTDTRNDGEKQLSIYSQWWNGTFGRHGWSRGSTVFFMLSTLVVLVWIVAETVGYYIGKRTGNFVLSLLSILVNVILLICIVAFLSNGASSANDRDGKRVLHGNACTTFILKWYDKVFQRTMRRLLGSGKDHSKSLFNKKNDAEEWSGRVHYLQREMSRLAEESNEHLNEHAKAMEQSVALSESRLQTEVKTVENNMIDFKLSLVREIKDSERRTEEMVKHSMNQLLRALMEDQHLE